MITRLSHVTVLVRNQDEALRFYTEKLGFEKRFDVAFGPGARWLTVAPVGQTNVEIVLQKPDPAMHGEADARQMEEAVGRGTTWVFECDDCRATYATLRERGVEFQSEPRQEPYGVEAVFVDLYGNSFSLLQPAEQPPVVEPAAQRPARSTDKAAIVAALQASHAQMQAALADLDAAAMTQAGATGHWSAKDVLAHIAAGNDWLADEVERASRGERPDWAEIKRQKAAGLFDNETRNTYDYEQSKDRPLAEVLDWWQQSTVRLVAAVEAAPESVLTSSDWWTDKSALGASIWTEHEGEHAQELSAWAAQSR